MSYLSMTEVQSRGPGTIRDATIYADGEQFHLELRFVGKRLPVCLGEGDKLALFDSVDDAIDVLRELNMPRCTIVLREIPDPELDPDLLWLKQQVDLGVALLEEDTERFDTDAVRDAVTKAVDHSGLLS